MFVGVVICAFAWIIDRESPVGSSNCACNKYLLRYVLPLNGGADLSYTDLF